MSELSLTNVQDVLREKIKSALLDSIPQEKLDSVIKSEFDKFFKDRSEKWENGSRTYKTRFETQVETILKEESAKAIKEEVHKFLDSKTLGYHINSQMDGGIKNYCEMIAPALVTSFFRDLAATALSDLQQRSY